MAETTSTGPTKPFPGLIIALAGLLSSLAGPVLYVILMDQPFLRRTGLIMWALMLDGVFLGLFAAWKDPRNSARIIAGLNLTLLVLAVVGFFVVAGLPETALAQLSSAPDFTLPDQTGQSRSLKSMLKAGPVLLIFYRGHW